MNRRFVRPWSDHPWEPPTSRMATVIADTEILQRELPISTPKRTATAQTEHRTIVIRRGLDPDDLIARLAGWALQADCVCHARGYSLVLVLPRSDIGALLRLSDQSLKPK